MRPLIQPLSLGHLHLIASVASEPGGLIPLPPAANVSEWGGGEESGEERAEERLEERGEEGGEESRVEEESGGERRAEWKGEGRREQRRRREWREERRAERRGEERGDRTPCLQFFYFSFFSSFYFLKSRTKKKVLVTRNCFLMEGAGYGGRIKISGPSMLTQR